MSLLDSSSLFEAVKKRTLQPVSTCIILDLTKYEVGNIFWKHVHLLKKMRSEDARELYSAACDVMRFMGVVGIEGLEDRVLELAETHEIAFYDASYLAIAKASNLLLVTEDAKLARIANKLEIRAYGLAEFLGSH